MGAVALHKGGYVSLETSYVPSGDTAGCTYTQGSRPPPRTALKSTESQRTIVGSTIGVEGLFLRVSDSVPTHSYAVSALDVDQFLRWNTMFRVL